MYTVIMYTPKTRNCPLGGGGSEVGMRYRNFILASFIQPKCRQARADGVHDENCKIIAWTDTLWAFYRYFNSASLILPEQTVIQVELGAL